MILNKRNLIYVGRPSLFGNPFSIGKDGTREEVIAKFKEYFYRRLSTDKMFKKEVHKLKGKNLVCWCKPLSCHADVIEEYLKNAKSVN